LFEKIRGKDFFTHAALICALVLLTVFAPDAHAAKAKLPPYRPGGSIPGTELKYEKLSVSDRGEVAITVVNPTDRGVAYTANFSFYGSKDEYLTGFALTGFARAGGKILHSFDLDDYKAYRKAVTMKVLGRSGRTGKNPAPDDGAE
jgi:hypothetical protein